MANEGQIWSTHTFLTHQTGSFNSISTAQKKPFFILKCTSMNSIPQGLLFISTTYFKIHNSKYVISGFLASSARHMQRASRAEGSRGTCLAWRQGGLTLQYVHKLSGFPSAFHVVLSPAIEKHIYVFFLRLWEVELNCQRLRTTLTLHLFVSKR